MAVGYPESFFQIRRKKLSYPFHYGAHYTRFEFRQTLSPGGRALCTGCMRFLFAFSLYTDGKLRNKEAYLNSDSRFLNFVLDFS